MNKENKFNAMLSLASSIQINQTPPPPPEVHMETENWEYAYECLPVHCITYTTNM